MLLNYLNTITISFVGFCSNFNFPASIFWRTIKNMNTRFLIERNQKFQEIVRSIFHIFFFRLLFLSYRLWWLFKELKNRFFKHQTDIITLKKVSLGASIVTHETGRECHILLTREKTKLFLKNIFRKKMKIKFEKYIQPSSL